MSGGDPGAGVRGRRVVVASSNAGKLAEIGSLLAAQPLVPVAVGEYTSHSPHESGLTFVENAIIKARHAAEVSGCAALADDSGLVVDALGGAPGVRSARYAGERASDAENVAALLGALEGVEAPERGAAFVCAIVWLRRPDDPVPIICEGRWSGRIVCTPRGANGFGYDPVFWSPEHACTAAELSPEQKNAISHRGRALRALAERLAGAAG